jgi:hypothetical protein
MQTLGLALQLGGLGVAAVALLWELNAMRRDDNTPKLPDSARLINQPNPWEPRKSERVTDLMRIKVPGSRDPEQFNMELVRAAAHIAREVERDRQRAMKAWDAQTRVLLQLQHGSQQLLESQLASISGLRRDTRVRVVIEMGGLVLAIVGTVISANSSAGGSAGGAHVAAQVSCVGTRGTIPPCPSG